MNIILIGVQGSGKGTQAKLLQQKFGWDHVTTGEIFRKSISQKTSLGIIAKTFIDKGELVPDEYVFEIVKNALAARERGFILDGFPRNMKQMEFLEKNFALDFAVMLDLSDEKAIKRLGSRRVCAQCKADYNLLFNKPKVVSVCDICGGKIVIRDDDTTAAISRRIEKFHNETKRVIEHFIELKHLITINADQSVEAVHHEIITALGKS